MTYEWMVVSASVGPRHEFAPAPLENVLNASERGEWEVFAIVATGVDQTVAVVLRRPR